MPRRAQISRRAVVRAIAAGACVAVAPDIAPAAPPPAAVIRLRRGMNLWPWFSLTREFPPPRTDYDWPPYEQSRAIPGRRDLAALRNSGIDFVRIPVDPGPLLAFSGERRVDLTARVVAAVDMALAAGLSAIVNLHPNRATHHFHPRNLVRGVGAPMFVQYLGLTHDLAAQLARFDPARVAFEPLNEPPQDCASADWPIIQRELVRA